MRGHGFVADDSGLDPAELVDSIRALEELVCTATAAQAKLSVELDAAQRSEQAAAALPASRQGRGVAAQVARETACLSREDRATVDAHVAGDASRLEGMGLREVVSTCQQEAARLDAASVVARRRRAERERHVSLRPAHTDHAEEHVAGGATNSQNGQGLCEACNHAKQAPGWRARPSPSADTHHIDTTTPTGHTYRSRPPSLATVREVPLRIDYVLSA